jgi:hypothetical protein
MTFTREHVASAVRFALSRMTPAERRRLSCLWRNRGRIRVGEKDYGI